MNRLECFVDGSVVLNWILVIVQCYAYFPFRVNHVAIRFNRAVLAAAQSVLDTGANTHVVIREYLYMQCRLMCMYSSSIVLA